MSDLIPDATVDDRDARTAQAVIDAWLGETPDTLAATLSPLALRLGMHPGDLLELRGILTATLSEVRAAGVLEGHRAATKDRDLWWIEQLEGVVTEAGW